MKDVISDTSDIHYGVPLEVFWVLFLPREAMRFLLSPVFRPSVSPSRWCIVSRLQCWKVKISSNIFLGLIAPSLGRL